MMDIVTKKQMAYIEKIGAEDQGIGYDGLMQNAGGGAYEIISEKFNLKGKKVLILADKGNNGGDALVILEKLLSDTKEVYACLTTKRPDEEEQLELMRKKAPTFNFLSFEELKTLNVQFDFIIDGLFGTGFRGQLSEKHREVCKFINEQNAYKISLDLPSGTECDSGKADENAVKADLTITFHAKKPCHILLPSKENCGEVVVCKIGIDETDIKIEEPSVMLIEKSLAKPLLPKKPSNQHKGTAGRMLIIGGKIGMAGAVVMAAKSALKSGCGYVNVAVTEKVYNVVAPLLVPCVFTILPENNDGGISIEAKDKLEEALSKADSVVIGCGMGESEDTANLTRFVLDNFSGKIIVDADAVRTIRAKDFKKSKGELIITPHYKEASLITEREVKDIIEDRVSVAKEMALAIGGIVLLKSHQTIIADQVGNIFVNDCPNSGMAKAGSGDVLSGIIGSLAAQGCENPAVLGCFLHSFAGKVAKEEHTAYSVQPLDVIDSLEVGFKLLLEKTKENKIGY